MKLVDIQHGVRELLSLAYLADDLAQMSGGPGRLVTAERLLILQDIGKLCGIKVCRSVCRNCGGFLPFGRSYMYCNGACKQAAYRLRSGKVR